MADTLKYIFRSYDGDGDGKMEAREFYLFLFELGKKNLTKKQMQACFQFVLPTADATGLTLEDFMEGVPKLYEIQFKAPITRRSRTASIVAGNFSDKMGVSHSPSFDSKYSEEAMEMEKLLLAEKKRTVARNIRPPIPE